MDKPFEHSNYADKNCAHNYIYQFKSHRFWWLLIKINISVNVVHFISIKKKKIQDFHNDALSVWILH